MQNLENNESDGKKDGEKDYGLLCKVFYAFFRDAMTHFITHTHTHTHIRQHRLASCMPRPLPTDTPYTWHELLDYTLPATTSTHITAARVHDGAFGGLRPVTGVDIYTTHPVHTTFTADDAAHVQHAHKEWQARIDALQDSVKALQQQKAMAVTVQRALAVQLMHQYVHKRRAPNAGSDATRAPPTLWEACLAKAQKKN